MSTPCSTLEFYKVPALSPNYRDTYYFNSVTEQYNFFHGTTNVKQLLFSQYTRVSNNQVKVPFPQSEMIEYNYMLIKNARGYEETAPTGKSIYCFITNCEYVSDMCSLITFKVDVIQTLIVSATIRQSFVERCHSKTDVLFANREPEPFSIQNYTADDNILDQNGFYTFVGIASGTTISFDGGSSTTDTEPHVYNLQGSSDVTQDIYSGVEYFGFDLDASSSEYGGADLKRLIDYLNQSGTIDAVVDMFVVPKMSYTDGFLTHKVKDVTTSYEWIFDASSIKPTGSETLSGHVVRNKKLYNYPFCYMKVTNGTGEDIDLKWEEFSNTNEAKLAYNASWYGGGYMSYYPYDYEGISGANRNFRITLSHYPQCAFMNDVYKEWKAQKMGAEIAGNGLSFIGNTVASLGIGAISPTLGLMSEARSVGSFISNNGQIVAEAIEMSKKPNEIHNYKTSPENAISSKKFNIVSYRMSLSQAEAEQIDDFFTMFGYAQNKIMNVRQYLNDFANGNSRPKFVYIKTQGFSVQSNMPSEYKMEFNEVFNKGITFWKTDATVGDYSNNDV